MHFWFARLKKMRVSTKSTMTCNSNRPLCWPAFCPCKVQMCSSWAAQSEIKSPWPLSIGSKAGTFSMFLPWNRWWLKISILIKTRPSAPILEIWAWTARYYSSCSNSSTKNRWTHRISANSCQINNLIKTHKNFSQVNSTFLSRRQYSRLGLAQIRIKTKIHKWRCRHCSRCFFWTSSKQVPLIQWKLRPLQTRNCPWCQNLPVLSAYRGTTTKTISMEKVKTQIVRNEIWMAEFPEKEACKIWWKWQRTTNHLHHLIKTNHPQMRY